MTPTRASMHGPEPRAEFDVSERCICDHEQNIDGKSYSCTKEHRHMRGDPAEE
ncbi:hypothetical protein V1523DRAFT_412454 [Lipomyces doorenjongii]